MNSTFFCTISNKDLSVVRELLLFLVHVQVRGFAQGNLSNRSAQWRITVLVNGALHKYTATIQIHQLQCHIHIKL